MIFSIVIIMGILLVLYAYLKLRIARTKFSSAAIIIRRSRIVEVVESAAGYWKKWFVVEVLYDILDDLKEDTLSNVGIDKKSSWFSRRSDAEAVLNKIRLDSVCYIGKRGRTILIPYFPKHRLTHYLAIFTAGALLVSSGFVLGAVLG